MSYYQNFEQTPNPLPTRAGAKQDIEIKDIGCGSLEYLGMYLEDQKYEMLDQSNVLQA